MIWFLNVLRSASQTWDNISLSALKRGKKRKKEIVHVDVKLPTFVSWRWGANLYSDYVSLIILGAEMPFFLWDDADSRWQLVLFKNALMSKMKIWQLCQFPSNCKIQTTGNHYINYWSSSNFLRYSLMLKTALLRLLGLVRGHHTFKSQQKWKDPWELCPLQN